jgi:hypothetical protein
MRRFVLGLASAAIAPVHLAAVKARGRARVFSFVLVGGVIALALSSGSGARSVLAPTDVRVTRDDAAGSYLRYDGQTDAVTAACGTSRRKQSEPSIAVDPRDSAVIVAGANDHCISATNNADRTWMGFYRSIDGGQSWRASLVPGYPGDESSAGVASPTIGFCNTASDPTQAFDNQGRLFYGFTCRNTDTVGLQGAPENWSVLVATYGNDGAMYLRTALVAAGTPTPPNAGLEEDKPNLAVDRSAGPGGGNVYIAWGQVRAGERAASEVLFARSTDHGETFSHPQRLSAGPAFWSDVAVGPDGSVYVVWRSLGSERGGIDAIWIDRSTDQGRTFGAPQLVAEITPFDSNQFSGNDAPECGDFQFRCPSGHTYARFKSIPAVAADDSGVHIVWSAENATGEGKIFIRNSPDGTSFPTPPRQIDQLAIGHQWFPDIASADGVITVVFDDSRADPAYSPGLPPGNKADGHSSGPVVDAWSAASLDGGQTWNEQRLSTAPSSPNWENSGPNIFPFAGDYIYVSATPGRVWAAWSDERDVVPGIDLDDDYPNSDFDVAPCDFSQGNPPWNDPCYSQGGDDGNIYARRIR